MIACLSPSDQYAEENISTLNYAMKASFIANEPTQNIDPKMKLIQELRAKVATLQKELTSANKHIEMLSEITGGPMPAITTPSAPQTTAPSSMLSVPDSKGVSAASST